MELEVKKEERKILQKEKQRQIRISRKFLENKVKWEQQVIKKIDLLPPEPETHFNGRTVKPGFQFWLALCSAPAYLLKKLDVNIPETIYVNYSAYMITSDLENMSKMHIKYATDPNELLVAMKQRITELKDGDRYNPAKNWN